MLIPTDPVLRDIQQICAQLPDMTDRQFRRIIATLAEADQALKAARAVKAADAAKGASSAVPAGPAVAKRA